MGKKTQNDAGRKSSKDRKDVDSDSDVEPPPPPSEKPVEKKVEEKAELSLPVPPKGEMVIDRHAGYSSTTSMEHGPRGRLAVPHSRVMPLGTSEELAGNSPTSSPRRAKPVASPRMGTAKTHESSAKSLNSTAMSFKSS